MKENIMIEVNTVVEGLEVPTTQEKLGEAIDSVLEPLDQSNFTKTIDVDDPKTQVGGIDTGHLQSFFDRIERLNEEKDALLEDIKQVYLEAKSTGFDVKIMRKIVALRKLDPSDREEQDYLIDIYRKAVNV